MAPSFLLFIVSEENERLLAHFVCSIVSRIIQKLIERLVGNVGTVYHVLVFLWRQVVQAEVDRVDRVAFEMHFIVQVRGGRQTCIAHFADLVTFLHFFTRVYGHSVHVAI